MKMTAKGDSGKRLNPRELAPIAMKRRKAGRYSRIPTNRNKAKIVSTHKGSIPQSKNSQGRCYYQRTGHGRYALSTNAETPSQPESIESEGRTSESESLSVPEYAAMAAGAASESEPSQRDMAATPWPLRPPAKPS